MPLALTSPAFPPGGPLPPRYTCQGENISPPLSWASPPGGTRTLLLTMDGPQSPGRASEGSYNWVVFQIPGELRGLAEDQPRTGMLSSGALQGRNIRNKVGYEGPCPSPPGPARTYLFTLYALDGPLLLPACASRMEILVALAGHIVARSELRALYQWDPSLPGPTPDAAPNCS